MKIEYIETEQIVQEETTRYWFSVEFTDAELDYTHDDIYALSDTNGELTLLDVDGYPIESSNDPLGIRDALESRVVKLQL